MASTPDYPGDVQPDRAMSRILSSLRGQSAPASRDQQTPFVETTLSGDPVVIGIHVPHEPMPPADAELAYYAITRDGASQYQCPSLVEATRRLILSGVETHRITAVALAGRACRLRRAVLTVAKLDRLSRDARFILALVDTGAPLRFLDFPDLDITTSTGRMVLTMMASLAEGESRRNGERTRAAFAARRARGLRMTTTRPFTAADAAHALPHAIRANRRLAARWRADMRPIAEAVQAEGDRSLHATAAELNRLGYQTRRGQPWTYATLHQLLMVRPWETDHTPAQRET